MATRLKRQIQLVVLNKREFPKEILDKFIEISEQNIDEPQLKVKGATLLTLLEGTRYITESSNNNNTQASESDIFKQMDQISKKLF